VGDFKYTVLKVLSSTEPDAKGNRIDLRIVKWGENGKPVLEKRKMWYDEDNEEERTKKLSGLNAADLEIIMKHIGEVKKLLGGDDV
jgi:hypothetical protein